MYIDPLGIFLLIIGSVSFGMLIKWQNKTKESRPCQCLITEDTPEWDIGAYSNAWWERDKDDTEED